MPRVFAVFTSFHPDQGFADRVGGVGRQVDGTIVVDDGSGAAAEALLGDLERVGHRVIRSEENRGIAAALNTGVRAAMEAGAEYVLTLDQDTSVPPGYVADCLGTFAAAAAAGAHVAMAAPHLINGRPLLPPRPGPDGLLLVPEAIQSGLLVSTSAIDRIGLFDERLFIDCVDTEYCLRTEERGFGIAVAEDTRLEHALGERAPLRPFGIPLRRHGRIPTYRYHGPYRRYFITRNNIDLWFRYARRRPRWVLSSVKRELTTAITTLASGPHRLRQLRAVLAGARDGLLRRRGPMPRALRESLLPGVPGSDPVR